MRQLQQRYNEGETVDFKDLANPHLAAVMLKTFLRELTEPIMTFELYEEVLKIHGELELLLLFLSCFVLFMRWSPMVKKFDNILPRQVTIQMVKGHSNTVVELF